MNRVHFLGESCIAERLQYLDGSPALQLYIAETGEPMATATVRLDHAPPEGCAWIKDYSENKGMVDALVKAEIIFPQPVATARPGFVEVRAYRLVSP